VKYRELFLGLVLGATLATSVVVYAKDHLPSTFAAGPNLGLATSADGKTVFVASRQGVWKSSDGGETWRQLPVK